MLVTVDRGEMGCVMRVDLSDELVDSLEHIADVAAAARPDSAIAVVIDEDGANCRMCNDEYRELAGLLTTVLAERGIELLAAHVVDRVAAGGRWHCADGCGNAGHRRRPVGVAAGRGRGPGRPQALRPPRRAAGGHRRRPIPPAATRSPRSSTPANQTRRSARTTRRAPTSKRPSLRPRGWPTAPNSADDELARLAWALTDIRVRDTLYALAVGENAGQAESLWAVLSRTLPEPWRVEALVLLAFSAYARGDGPLAGVSLEAALRCDPTHRMAGMLDTALQSGMRPEQIRDLAITGYRLADRLGVQLPPMRAFGRRAG